MAKTIYLLQFNNYFNRTLKGPYSRIGDYAYNGGTIVGQITNMSLWNPNDGIDTNITSNLGLTAIPDYCVVCDGVDVLQRWFVTEAKRLQGQQYRLTLHRDVIAEENEKIMANTESYIERGWCDVSNDVIYNNEPMTFNEIKLGQATLHDPSCSAWIVGYLAIDSEFVEKEISFKYFGSTYYVTFTPELAKNEFAAPGIPYVTFYMPWKGMSWTDGCSIGAGVTQAAATAISKAFSGSKLLIDLQILPFCPESNIPESYMLCKVPSNSVYIQKLTPTEQEPLARTTVGYIGISTSEYASGICYRKLDNNTSIPFALSVNDIKVDSLTKKCRLVSPNGNGVWEFIPAKAVYNTTTEQQLTYTMTPMPFQPYIKVEPLFARMYGNNYDDQRGLICGGDFSLPQISDAWNTYQINNKNYQVMFNRQIESLDKQIMIGGASEAAGVISGTVGGVGGGAFSGSIMGGASGAMAGGIAGGAASLAGGIADISTNAILRADQRDAMIQQHNWQLDNIKAMPYGVSKASNFNSEQPKFPYIEFYNARGEEITNLEKFLSLKSYNISRYGKFSDYVKPTGRTWLQGTFVRLNGISDDSHYLAAIADEVKQGFYIEKGEN